MTRNLYFVSCIRSQWVGSVFASGQFENWQNRRCIKRARAWVEVSSIVWDVS